MTPLKYLALGCLAMLSACGSAPERIAVDEPIKRVTLVTDYVWQSKDWAGTISERSLTAGSYAASFADSGGVYYQGSANCFRIKQISNGSNAVEAMNGKTLFSWHCGLFIPKDSQKPVQIYYIIGSNTGVLFTDAPSPGQSGDAVGQTAQQQGATLGASPVQAGVAGGIAQGIMGGVIAYEKGRLKIWGAPPDATSFRAAMQF